MTSLQVGYWVALTLTPDSAPLNSYVGTVQALDGHGIRITLVDWISGRADGWDLFLPWSSIQSALVATHSHNVKGFGEAAGEWQQSIGEMRGEGGDPDDLITIRTIKTDKGD